MIVARSVDDAEDVGAVGEGDDVVPVAAHVHPGPARLVTVYANPGHAFMVIDGRRFDTSGRSIAGSRWHADARSTAGYVARHPAGL